MTKPLLLASRAHYASQHTQLTHGEQSVPQYWGVAAHMSPFAKVLAKSLAKTAIQTALVCPALFTRYESLLFGVVAVAFEGGPHGVGRVLLATYCTVYAALLICDRGMCSRRRQARPERARRAQ
ncbi:hypothetical protein PsYK624_144290 [Phanerochaete sordida]|uniref:Uncharacterized protein n=1 Tax=Phanerochaete sordida TaxID=48140 RepID=A0A9P3GNZ6_9APHY|nr:hypothetical protein PsYK624_144290 [Phanerochaete sordida]